MSQPSRRHIRSYRWLTLSGSGSALSLVHIGPESPLAPVVLQGTVDGARALLIGTARDSRHRHRVGHGRESGIVVFKPTPK